PDISSFFVYLRSYASRMSLSLVSERLQAFIKNPVALLALLAKMFLVICALFILFRLAGRAYDAMMERGRASKGLVRAGRYLCAMFVAFAKAHTIGISIWTLLFCALRFQIAPEPASYIFFYLCSIPYLLYLARSFMLFFGEFN